MSAAEGSRRVLIVSSQRDVSIEPPRGGGIGSRLARLSFGVERGRGGVQVHVEEVRRMLGHLGVPVEVVTPFDSQSLLPVPATAITKLVRRVSRPAAARWHRWWHAKLLDRSIGRKVASLPSAAVSWYANDPTAVALVAHRRRRQDRLVAMCHYLGSEAVELEVRGDCAPGDPYLDEVRRREHAALSSADLVLFVSEQARTRSAEVVGALEVPTDVMPNFLGADVLAEIDRARAEADGAMEAAGTGMDRLVSIGFLNPTKGHDHQLDIMSSLARRGSSAQLDIVGDGPESERLRARVVELGLTDRVTFLGQRHDVADLLASHDLFLHTARAESFGIVLIEAMAAGRAIAVVPVGGIPAVVRDGVDAVFLTGSDADADAGAVAALLADPIRRNAMGAAGRTRVEGAFTSESVAPILMEALDCVPVRARLGS